jgi:hypothetical protein
MPKFYVKLARDVLQEAEVVVDAADENDAEDVAVALAKSQLTAEFAFADPPKKEIDWSNDEIGAIEAIKVYAVDNEPDAA